MSEATPRPWHVKKSRTYCAVRGPNGEYVAENIRKPEDAALIVTAANVFYSPELIAVLRKAKEHTAELREAWERGAISECDGHGGERSNRNADIDNVIGWVLDKVAKEQP